MLAVIQSIQLLRTARDEESDEELKLEIGKLVETNTQTLCECLVLVRNDLVESTRQLCWQIMDVMKKEKEEEEKCLHVLRNILSNKVNKMKDVIGESFTPVQIELERIENEIVSVALFLAGLNRGINLLEDDFRAIHDVTLNASHVVSPMQSRIGNGDLFVPFVQSNVNMLDLSGSKSRGINDLLQKIEADSSPKKTSDEQENAIVYKQVLVTPQKGLLKSTNRISPSQWDISPVEKISYT